MAEGKIRRCLVTVPAYREEPQESFFWALPKFVHHGHSLHTGNSAMGSAWLHRVVFMLQILTRVFFKRAGMTALLRAIAHQAVLTNVEVAAPRATMPVIRPPLSQIFIKTLIQRRVMYRLGEI